MKPKFGCCHKPIGMCFLPYLFASKQFGILSQLFCLIEKKGDDVFFYKAEVFLPDLFGSNSQEEVQVRPADFLVVFLAIVFLFKTMV